MRGAEIGEYLIEELVADDDAPSSFSSERCCISDRQEYKPHHFLNDIIDSPVGPVRDKFGIAVMDGDELAEEALEADIYNRSAQGITDKKQLMLRISVMGEFPNRNFNISCGIVNSLGIEFVQQEKFCFVVVSIVQHTVQAIYKRPAHGHLRRFHRTPGVCCR